MHISRPLVFFLLMNSVSGFAAVPQWKQDIDKRAKELETLQQQNAVTTGHGELEQIDFPTTIADVPFTERIQIAKEGLEPFKDLKAYREINVKNAAEWCEEHKDSAECWEYRCSVNGPNADSNVCISWRCKKPKYYEENKQECDMHEHCAKDPKSEECMKYKCYETDEKDSTDCQKWLCDHDATFKSENEELCNKLNPPAKDQTNPGGAEKKDPADPEVRIIKGDQDVLDPCKDKDKEYKREHLEECYPPHYTLAITGPTKKGCYSECSAPTDDDVTTKVLHPLFGKDYCVKAEKLAASDIKDIMYGDDIDKAITIDQNFPVVEVATQKKLKIPKDKIDTVISELTKIKDNGKCDWAGSDVVAYVLYQYDPFISEPYDPHKDIHGRMGWFTDPYRKDNPMNKEKLDYHTRMYKIIILDK